MHVWHCHTSFKCLLFSVSAERYDPADDEDLDEKVSTMKKAIPNLISYFTVLYLKICKLIFEKRMTDRHKPPY